MIDDDEIPQATGRPMSQQLAAALNNVTGDDRQRTIKAFAASAPESSSRLGPLYRALATELYLCEIREKAAHDQFVAEFEDDDLSTAPSPGVHLDGIPDPPAPTGPARVFDPETGELR